MAPCMLSVISVCYIGDHRWSCLRMVYVEIFKIEHNTFFGFSGAFPRMTTNHIKKFILSLCTTHALAEQWPTLHVKMINFTSRKRHVHVMCAREVIAQRTPRYATRRCRCCVNDRIPTIATYFCRRW